MRRALFTLAALASICLSGCATVPGSGGGAILTAAYIAEIQATVRSACGYLPTANTIAQLFASSSRFANAIAIANAICSAMTPPAPPLGIMSRSTAPRRVAAPLVNGVRIRGQFVR